MLRSAPRSLLKVPGSSVRSNVVLLVAPSPPTRPHPILRFSTPNFLPNRHGLAAGKWRFCCLPFRRPVVLPWLRSGKPPKPCLPPAPTPSPERPPLNLLVATPRPGPSHLWSRGLRNTNSRWNGFRSSTELRRRTYVSSRKGRGCSGSRLSELLLFTNENGQPGRLVTSRNWLPFANNTGPGKDRRRNVGSKRPAGCRGSVCFQFGRSYACSCIVVDSDLFLRTAVLLFYCRRLLVPGSFIFVCRS
jgi:hypothetical protein